jgi:hypothetical protein
MTDVTMGKGCKHGIISVTRQTLMRQHKFMASIRYFLTRMVQVDGSYITNENVGKFCERHTNTLESDFLRIMYAYGANAVLKGDSAKARAHMTSLLFVMVFLDKSGVKVSQPTIEMRTHFFMIRLVSEDMSDAAIIRQIAHEIPCTCLDKRVKEIDDACAPVCDNCSLQDSTTQYWDCVCGLATYCGTACQKAARRTHKKQCKLATGKSKPTDGGNN